MEYLKSLFATVKEVLLHPKEFFSKLETGKSYRPPLIFALILFAAPLIVNLIFSLLFGRGLGLPQYLSFLALLPLIIFIVFPLFLFAVTGVLHIFVKLFGGAGKFKDTFNIMSYISSTNIFNLIPFIGGLIASAWNVTLIIIGYKKVHKLSTAKAVFAFSLPLSLALVLMAASVAVPAIQRAKIQANETAAESSLKTIAAAAENYSAQKNGQYPSDEFDLKYAPAPYLDKIYNNQTLNGYIYSSTMDPKGYKITAVPVKCGVTGSKTFTIETKGSVSSEDCK